VLRGLALFGVLLVNLDGAFRVSLFEHILHTPTDATSVLIAAVLEFKALAIFSFLFGVGTAIQAERAGPRGIGVGRFLTRRFAVLIGLGLVHMLLIWNGDILVLYGVCGLLLLPLRRLPPLALALCGVALILLPHVISVPIPFPSVPVMTARAALATRIYSIGSFTEIVTLRWSEVPFIVPLYFSVLPQTSGLMVCGAAAWRSGVLREPERHRTLLLAAAIVAGALGAATREPIPLACCYAACVLLWITPARATGIAAPFAALGRMAFTNYLAQSVILGFIFYSYGLGLFGRLSPAAGAAIGVAIYAAQLVFSVAWLRRYRFGPAEWLWRALSYGRVPPMRHRL
jgi:uncharacterized protein